jgi:hypothetical protein
LRSHLRPFVRYKSGPTKSANQAFAKDRDCAALPKENMMLKLSRMALIAVVSGGLAAPCAVVAMTTSAAAISPLATYDTDKDGTLDLDEIKAAAAAAFDRLDKDKDGTVDHKETGLHMSRRELKEADTDNDGTLSKDEYLALAEKLFKEADKNQDGKLTARELRTVPGHALLRLIK